MAYVDRDRSRETALSSVAATVVVGGIGFALVTGLAMTVVHQSDPPLTIHEWAAPPPPPPLPTTRPLPKTSARIWEAVAPARTIVPIVPSEATIVMPRSDLALEGQGAGVSIPLPPPPPAVDRSIRAVPRGDPGAWVTPEDYPASALRAGQQGTTGVRLDIGSDGRATACAVTASSGSDALDQTACRMLMRRARFDPARDAGGTPVAASYTSRIAWRLPAD